MVNTGMSSLMVLNMASGFADAGRVWQKPAAAVEMNAAATGFTPTVGASMTIMGMSTADRADRDWMRICASVDSTMMSSTNTARAVPDPALRVCSATYRAAPELVSAWLMARVAAMNSSSVHGTFLMASSSEINPNPGATTTRPPRSATRAGWMPCSDSVLHSSTARHNTSNDRDSDCDSGPLILCTPPACSARDSRLRSSFSLRCLLDDVANKMTSAARCEVTIAKGKPAISQLANPIDFRLLSCRIWSVIRCAPAPMSEPTAESRITDGNNKLSVTTSHECWALSTLPRATNTGTNSAARPAVAGTANTVHTVASVTACTSMRGFFVPAVTMTAPRMAKPDVATPVEMMKAPMSSHVVVSPSGPKNSSTVMTPVSTKILEPPRAT